MESKHFKCDHCHLSIVVMVPDLPMGWTRISRRTGFAWTVCSDTCLLKLAFKLRAGTIPLGCRVDISNFSGTADYFQMTLTTQSTWMPSSEDQGRESAAQNGQ
jgi:hypothetical protein